jgi:signal transduction histidine kinase
VDLNGQDVSRLIVELWVRAGYASTACVLLQEAPEVLMLTSMKRQSDDTRELKESTISESYSVFLDSEALAAIAPTAVGATDRHQKSWPALMAAIVIEFSAKDVQPDAATVSTDVLDQLTEQLLQKMESRQTFLPRSNHLEAMAEFAAGAGHEINNPLASIIGQTQILLRQRESVEYRQALETIGSQAWRIRDMIGDSMLFARPPEPEFHPTDLVQLIERVVKATSKDHAANSIQFEFRCGLQELIVSADSSQISSFISHLLRNAAESVANLGDQGVVTIMLRLNRRGRAAEILVRDNGPGITDPKVRRHLFDPFFSGRQAGRGLGFGLCLCWRIVESHRGILMYDEGAENGCEFHAAFPLTQDGHKMSK